MTKKASIASVGGSADDRCGSLGWLERCVAQAQMRMQGRAVGMVSSLGPHPNPVAVFYACCERPNCSRLAGRGARRHAG